MFRRDIRCRRRQRGVACLSLLNVSTMGRWTYLLGGSRKGHVQWRENIERYSSSAWAERGFCKRCGSSLFYRLKETNQYILNMGSFDDQRPFKIASEIYVDDKPAGYDFAASIRVSRAKSFSRLYRRSSHVRSPNHCMQPTPQPVIKFASANLSTVWRAADTAC